MCRMGGSDPGQATLGAGRLSLLLIGLVASHHASIGCLRSPRCMRRKQSSGSTCYADMGKSSHSHVTHEHLRRKGYSYSPGIEAWYCFAELTLISEATRELLRHRQTVMTDLEIGMGVCHVCDRSKGGVRQSNHTDAGETVSAVGFLECAVIGSGVLPSRRMKVTPRSLHLQHMPMHAHHRILDGHDSTASLRACGFASTL
jgi:hypothetical protein